MPATSCQNFVFGEVITLMPSCYEFAIHNNQIRDLKFLFKSKQVRFQSLFKSIWVINGWNNTIRLGRRGNGAGSAHARDWTSLPSSKPCKCLVLSVTDVDSRLDLHSEAVHISLPNCLQDNERIEFRNYGRLIIRTIVIKYFPISFNFSLQISPYESLSFKISCKI